MVKIIGYLLVIIHFVLFLWSAGGMLEWLLHSVPWEPYSNPDFPRVLLFFHWLVVLFASVGFLLGYFTHWKLTPSFMLLAYGFMALICVIETFGFMTSSTKYLAMAIEFATYIGILIVLHHSKFRAAHFSI